jgi:monoamine oxidase
MAVPPSAEASLSPDFDAVVIGAGAAGLAAAADLELAGLNTSIVEGRDRLGGRVWTFRHPESGMPMELGAEFVHEPAPETSRIVKAASIDTSRVEGEHWQARDGRITRADDLWERVERVLAGLDPNRTPDRSFRDFLRATNGRISEEDRDLALGFVEGFNAADAGLISERALAAGQGGTEGAARAARIVGGYDRIIDGLARNVTGRIRLGVIARRLEWASGQVCLSVQDSRTRRDLPSLLSRAAVVTVPLAILQRTPPQAAAIEFAPELPELREAASRLVMGAAVRLCLCFRERFWEEVDAAPLERVGFLHTPEGPYNVWWNQAGEGVLLLVAWAGGPRVAQLAGASKDRLEELALDQLARALDRHRGKIEASLECTMMHDWQTDPLSGGAYSYAAVGGAEAGDTLARPVAGTLFFAGEATAAAGRSGTVESAIATGRRAARDLVLALG